MTFIPNPDFSKFTVLARPLPNREDRVFKSGRNDVTYGSFSLALAKGEYGTRGGLVVLIEHGGGREAVAIQSLFGEEADWLMTITDERRQYAALWAIYETATKARDVAAQETANKYCAAFVDGRLKKRRKNRRVFVEIQPPATAMGAIQ